MHARQRVAVVEDDPSALKATVRLLTILGYATQGFASAEAFLDSDAARETDYLVVDIHLGGMSGIELRHLLSASGRALPVIFVTGAEDEATYREALAAGCVAFLRKPFEPRLLIAAIEETH
jgi:FixJ family two-component response regulator